MSGYSPEHEALLLAATKMVGRCGADSFELRYSEPDEPGEGPVVWLGIAAFDRGRFKVGAGAHPLGAILALLDELIDGAKCAHCGRPSGVVADSDHSPLLDAMREVVCWYRYDPDVEDFVRGCET